MNQHPTQPVFASEPTWRLVAAFATIYIVWGTTYFVVGRIVAVWPPLLMTSVRFAAAGLFLFVWRRWWVGAAAPTWIEWKSAAWISVLLLLLGYGLTVTAQQRVPSGMTALMVSITPLHVVWMEWASPSGRRPSPWVFLGLALGMAGMALLIGPARLAAARNADVLSVCALALASLSWAAGSVFGRLARQNPDVFLAAGMQMLSGAIWLGIASAAMGEFHALPTLDWSPAIIAGWAYLTIAGSILAYSAFIYLLKVSTPARVGTNAFVNPVVAVFVGWAFGGEIVTAQVIAAAALLLAGVALIARYRKA